MAVVSAPNLLALDPSRAISQYIHDQWTADQGYLGGSVSSIAQASDGYLWIGTEKGLLRFDGANHFRLFNQANTIAFQRSGVLGLKTDGDGNLWIRLQSQGLLRYKDGVFDETFRNLPLDLDVTAMGSGLHGEILLARPGEPLRYRSGELERLGSGMGSTAHLVISIAETADGKVWMGTRDAGVVYLRDGREFAPPGLANRQVNCLEPDGNRLWIGTDAGLFLWNGKDVTKVSAPLLRDAEVLSMARDRESNLWLGTTRGLTRLNVDGSVSTQNPSARRARVTALFEDREGNLWVGGISGIERYRNEVFLMYSKPTTEPRDEGGPIFADAMGRTWFGPANGGLEWFGAGETNHFNGAGISTDLVYSIHGGPQSLWIGRQRGGLTQLVPKGDSFLTQTYRNSDGLAPGVVCAVHQNRDGTVWAGTLTGGVSRVRDGRITTYNASSGLAANTVTAIEEDGDGGMWFATPNGLSYFSNDAWRTYTSRDGLPPGRVNCLTRDSGGILWVGTDAGLAFIRRGRLDTPQAAPDALFDEILGIVDDKRGSLWVSTANRVVRTSRDQLLGDNSRSDEFREFGADDGLSNTEGVRRSQSVTIDHFGRVWFSLQGGIAVVDPAALSRRLAPAVIHIENVSIDGVPVTSPEGLRIQAGRHTLTFSFVGLSLSAPERVRLKYRLDGYDTDWSKPVPAGERPYTNLGPNKYRFRLIASNSDGVWDKRETAIDFEVLPAIWQTVWFQISILALCVASALAVYRLRLIRLTKRLNLRFEARLSERTLIAQNLHDTLLQGVLSAAMQLHVALGGVPYELPARRRLDRVLELLQQASDEGRNALQGLRSTESGIDDLEASLSRLGEDHFISPHTSFRVIVEGRNRALNPLIRDEVYRIGREALVNSFRHSGANSIEAEIQYGRSQLRLVIRDNGAGIDEETLRVGREGHWGLIGIRERADRIGAKLRVLSRHPGGTEVELTIQGKAAFSLQHAGTGRSWWGRWLGIRGKR